MRCPICDRRLVGRMCPAHGNVVGGTHTANTDVRTIGVISAGLSSAVESLSPVVGQVMLWWGDSASPPSGWAYTGLDADVGGNLHYLHYTG